jgi:CelD/BcsL family acetyltransferase involved in cellulose biosynthesis
LPASFELFKASRSAKLFADGRRQRKRLSEIGAVRIEVAADAADAAPMLAAMTRQKSRRWLESGSRDLFAVPEYLAFYRKLTKYRLTGEPSGARVHVSSLSVGGEVIATHWGVVFRDRFYYLMPGYEAGSWARYSAGRLLLEDLVRRCIGEGVRVFDLTVGDETYKRDWADHTLLLYEYLRPGTLRGSVFVAWRRLRERLKRNTRLRHRVQQVRARFGTRPRRG